MLTANKDINRTNKRALRVLYGDYSSSFGQLLAMLKALQSTKKPTKSYD